MNVNDVEEPEKTANMMEEIFKKQHELAKNYTPIEIASGIGYGILFGKSPFDLNEQRSQYLCKDFAWRITEEMTECTECLCHSEVDINPTTIEHAREELIDALHFLIELYILCGVDCQKLSLYSIDYIHNYNIFSEHVHKDNLLDAAFLLIKSRVVAHCTSNSDNDLDYHQWCADATRQTRKMTKKINIVSTQAYKVIEYIGRAMNCLKQKPWKQTHVLTDIKRFESNLCLAFYEWVTVAHLLGMNAESVYSCYFRKSEVNKFRQRSKY